MNGFRRSRLLGNPVSKIFRTAQMDAALAYFQRCTTFLTPREHNVQQEGHRLLVECMVYNQNPRSAKEYFYGTFAPPGTSLLNIHVPMSTTLCLLANEISKRPDGHDDLLAIMKTMWNQCGRHCYGVLNMSVYDTLARTRNAVVPAYALNAAIAGLQFDSGVDSSTNNYFVWEKLWKVVTIIKKQRQAGKNSHTAETINLLDKIALDCFAMPNFAATHVLPLTDPTSTTLQTAEVQQQDTREKQQQADHKHHNQQQQQQQQEDSLAVVQVGDSIQKVGKPTAAETCSVNTQAQPHPQKRHKQKKLHHAHSPNHPAWITYHTSEGKPYYHNPTTNKTVWEKPEGEITCAVRPHKYGSHHPKAPHKNKTQHERAAKSMKQKGKKKTTTTDIAPNTTHSPPQLEALYMHIGVIKRYHATVQFCPSSPTGAPTAWTIWKNAVMNIITKTYTAHNNFTHFIHINKADCESMPTGYWQYIWAVLRIQLVMASPYRLALLTAERKCFDNMYDAWIEVQRAEQVKAKLTDSSHHHLIHTNSLKESIVNTQREADTLWYRLPQIIEHHKEDYAQTQAKILEDAVGWWVRWMNRLGTVVAVAASTMFTMVYFRHPLKKSLLDCELQLEAIYRELQEAKEARKKNLTEEKTIQMKQEEKQDSSGDGCSDAHSCKRSSAILACIPPEELKSKLNVIFSCIRIFASCEEDVAEQTVMQEGLPKHILDKWVDLRLISNKKTPSGVFYCPDGDAFRHLYSLEMRRPGLFRRWRVWAPFILQFATQESTA